VILLLPPRLLLLLPLEEQRRIKLPVPLRRVRSAAAGGEEGAGAEGAIGRTRLLLLRRPGVAVVRMREVEVVVRRGRLLRLVPPRI